MASKILHDLSLDSDFISYSLCFFHYIPTSLALPYIAQSFPSKGILPEILSNILKGQFLHILHSQLKCHLLERSTPCPFLSSLPAGCFYAKMVSLPTVSHNPQSISTTLVFIHSCHLDPGLNPDLGLPQAWFCSLSFESISYLTVYQWIPFLLNLGRGGFHHLQLKTSTDNSLHY